MHCIWVRHYCGVEKLVFREIVFRVRDFIIVVFLITSQQGEHTLMFINLYQTTEKNTMGQKKEDFFIL